MTPRTRCRKINSTYDEIIDYLKEQFSHALYEDNTDNIIGLFVYKDLFAEK